MSWEAPVVQDWSKKINLIDMLAMSSNTMAPERLGSNFLCIISKQTSMIDIPESKVHGANRGPIWGRQDPGGPHVGPMKIAIRDIVLFQWNCPPVHGTGPHLWYVNIGFDNGLVSSGNENQNSLIYIMGISIPGKIV